MARVLLVEGETAIAQPLVRALARAGHATTTVGTGSQALALADDVPFDVALVDAKLPDGDGHAVVDELHRRVRAPVVMLSDSREQADRDAWHDGAEDFAVKPISGPQAVALVHAVLRRWRAAGGVGEVLRVGPLELDTLLQRVQLNGQELRLPPKEIALLARLMRVAGRAIPREELLLDVWGEAATSSSRTLDVHIGTLRSRLGDDPTAPRYIHTVRGIGFRLSSPAELQTADDDVKPGSASDDHR